MCKSSDYSYHFICLHCSCSCILLYCLRLYFTIGYSRFFLFLVLSFSNALAVQPHFQNIYIYIYNNSWSGHKWINYKLKWVKILLCSNEKPRIFYFNEIINGLFKLFLSMLIYSFIESKLQLYRDEYLLFLTMTSNVKASQGVIFFFLIIRILKCFDW